LPNLIEICEQFLSYSIKVSDLVFVDTVYFDIANMFLFTSLDPRGLTCGWSGLRWCGVVPL